MDTPSFDSDLHLALSLADTADALSLDSFDNADFSVRTKPDMTFVTDADQGVERALRDQLATHRPDDNIFGEEYGHDEDGATSRRWIIDPIDGTHNFVRGVPVWATLIGLQVDRDVVVGVVSAPALGRRWWASAGGGAWTIRTFAGGQPRQIHVSGVNQLDHASVSYSSLGGWKKHRMDTGLSTLFEQVWRTRAYGDFWSYMMVAEGVVDIAAEPELEVYDMAALVPIVSEAGGRFTDLDGRLGPWGTNALATNDTLHSTVLRILHS